MLLLRADARAQLDRPFRVYVTNGRSNDNSVIDGHKPVDWTEIMQ